MAALALLFSHQTRERMSRGELEIHRDDAQRLGK
jgi:hypothetical protein